MKREECIEKISRCMEKAGLIFTVSDDPDEIVDIGFTENGTLSIYDKETIYTHDDIERIRFFRSPDDCVTPAYLRIDMKNGERIILDEDGSVEAELLKDGAIVKRKNAEELLAGIAEAKKRGCEKDEFVIIDGRLIAYNGVDKVIKIPQGVVEIIPEVFRGSGIVRVECPDSLRSIESCVFEECAKLEEVSLNEGLKGIGYGAFMDCKSLKAIEIPATVKYISHSAFSRSGVKKVEGLTNSISVGKNVFSNTPYELSKKPDESDEH